MTKLEKTRKYTDYFNEAMKTYEMQKGEKIRHCIDDSLGIRYFNPAWAVSSLGVIYSIQKTGLKPLKPWLSGNRLDRYQVTNTFGDRRLKVRVSRLMAVYFCDRTVLQKDPEHPIDSYTPKEEAEKIFQSYWEVHHIQPIDKAKPELEDDRPENLQFIPRHTHQLLTQMQNQHGLFNFKKHEETIPDGETIVCDSKNAVCLMMIIDNIPEWIDKEFVEKMIVFAELNGLNALEYVRKRVGKQITIRFEAVPIDQISFS